jgi:hypothetical protein
MSEAVEQPTVHGDLVREVFIDPIRTVVVIDDEYPTIDALVAKEIDPKDQSSWKAEDLQRVRQILDFARNKSKPWLVDVHDAKRIKVEAETRIAPYLDHSDLMILDYHLDGDDGSGDASIKILRQLARNGHHNLVILYTKGYPGDSDRALREVALGLAYPDAKLGKDDKRMATVGAAVDQWNDIAPDILDHLLEQISSDVYLYHRKDQPPSYRKFLARPESSVLKAAIENKPSAVDINVGDLVDWLFWEREKTLKSQLSTVDLGPIEMGQAGDVTWLRSERLFVTLVPKSDPPTVFEDRLSTALVHSFPGPHQLLLAKMRAVLDDQGSHAEVAILGDKAIQTAWLDDFLNPIPADESSSVLAAINRHWEALGDQMRGTLQPFSAKIRQSFVGVEKAKVFAQCGLDQKDLTSNATILAYNRFISTKQFDRSHLTTGHVFSMPTSDAEGAPQALWICLSPACDMVPGQKTGGWNSRLGSSIPFVAVRLIDVTDNNAAGSATSNNFLFFEVDGPTKAYSIYPNQGDVARNPEWEQMFVAKHGRFKDGNKITVSMTLMKDDALIASEVEATVVAQLRAEYALNLLQRMGSFLFRPGLGMHFKKRN